MVGLSLVVESRGYSLLQYAGFATVSLLAEDKRSLKAQ